MFGRRRHWRKHVLKAIQQGGSGYIVKPFSKRLLLTKVAEALKKLRNE